MSNNTTQSSGSIRFVGLLAILFIGLKLANFITWSWWWVLSPLWIPALLVLLIMLIAAIVYEIIKSKEN